MAQNDGVALIPWATRLWAERREVIGSNWRAAKAGHWDLAIKGNSALQRGLSWTICDDVDDELKVT